MAAWRDWKFWRLVSGCVLYFFITTHLLNHALGLISLNTMVGAGEWFAAFWRSLPATILLYGALLTHLGLVVWSIWRRRLLNLRPGEWLQMLAGFCIVPLAAIHVVGTRMIHDLYGVGGGYIEVLLAQWHFDWPLAIQQSALVVVIWLHGTIGVYFWLRLRPWWPSAAPLLYAIALLIPVLGLLGFAETGKQVAARAAADPDWVRAMLKDYGAIDAGATARLLALVDVFKFGFLGALAAVFAGRWLRHTIERRRAMVRVTYGDGRQVTATAGLTFLEISRSAGIPHASVCGGRGRCSTCRVRIGMAQPDLPAPSAEESRVLARIGAPQSVRLACQTRPAPGEYQIAPLLPANAQAADGFRRASQHHGQERDIAILFADLRGFTSLAEHRLPYDTVFVLNRYFSAMGSAIEQAGGHVDKFIGDGVMALFGVDTDRKTACRQALDAARRMGLALGELNTALRADIKTPLRIGIGIHAGTCIVGDMGHGQARHLTAIGDAVNTASRLESMSKELGCQLVVSADVLARSESDIGQWPRHDVAVRGRQTAMQVVAVPDAARLELG